MKSAKSGAFSGKIHICGVIVNDLKGCIVNPIKGEGELPDLEIIVNDPETRKRIKVALKKHTKRDAKP